MALGDCDAERGDRGERGASGRLFGPGPPTHRRDRRVRIPTVLDEQVDDRIEAPGAHENHERPAGLRERGPIGVGGSLRGILVAGHDGEVRREAAVGDRDSCVGGCRDRAGDTGHDFERNARVDEHLGLFAAAAEHERVAALEPHHGRSGLTVLDQRCVDPVLIHGHAARRLPDVDAQRAGRCEIEERRMREPVVHHNVGPRQQLRTPNRDQPGVARPGTDEIDGHAGTPAPAVPGPNRKWRPAPTKYTVIAHRPSTPTARSRRPAPTKETVMRTRRRRAARRRRGRRGCVRAITVPNSSGSESSAPARRIVVPSSDASSASSRTPRSGSMVA